MIQNASVSRLHLGKKVLIEKQQYSKLRTYNKISMTLTNRVVSPKTSRSRQKGHRMFGNLEEAQESVDKLRKQCYRLEDQNREFYKNLRQEEKVQRLIYKLKSQIGQKFVEQLGDMQDIEPENVVFMLEFVMGLELIKNESKLQDKNQLLRYLQNGNYKKKTDISQNNWMTPYTKFLKVNLRQEIFSKKVNQMQKEKMETISHSNSLNKQLKSLKKDKLALKKQLQELNYVVKETLQNIEIHKERIMKNSCQYIQVKSGEMRNQSQLKAEICQVQQKYKEYQKQFHNALEQKMQEKIQIINEIDKLNIKKTFDFWQSF